MSSMASSPFVGTWKEIDSSNNYDEYLKKMGFGYFIRKAAVKVKPALIIENYEKNWIFSFRSKFKNTDLMVSEDVEFVEKNMDGSKVKSILRLETENRIVHEQRNMKTHKLKTVIIKEVDDDKLTFTLIAGKTECKKIFKRVPKSCTYD